MATSTIKFYKNDLLRVDKNFMYSERKESSYFETFLNKSLKKTIDNFQYIKHGLDISIKVKESQTDLYNKATTNLPYNYVSIKNSDSDRIYYYYIVSGTWRSSNCIQYELSMDTIATFWDTIQTSMTDKSTVVREHRDRFYKVTGALRAGSLLIRKIDPVSEGIQVANKVMTQDKIINDTNISTNVNKWYLIYRTEVNKDNLSDVPIKCYLCADKSIKFNTNNNFVVNFKTSELNKDYTYYLVDTPSNKSATELASVTYNPQEGTSPITYTLGSKMTGPDTTLKVIRIFYESNKWKIQLMRYTGGGTTQYEYYSTGSGTFEINDTKNELIFNNLNLGFIHKSQIITTDYYTILSYCDEDPVFGQQITVDGIDSVDRTMSNLNTIIELPYCATNDIIFISSTQLYNYNSDNWEYNYYNLQFKLKNMNTEFYRNIQQSYNIPDMAYNIIGDEISSFSTNQYKLESKIYHSDFSQLKYVYDSFSINVDRERFNISGDLTTGPTYDIDFKQSNNITSNLLFRVQDNQDAEYKKITDNENILLATRNNEVTIYQDAYINYMRTGYNYDKKTQSIQDKQQILGVLSSAVQSAISVGSNIGSIISNSSVLSKTLSDKLLNSTKEANKKLRALKKYKSTLDEDDYSYQRKLIRSDLFDITNQAQQEYDTGKISQFQSFGTSTQLMIQNSIGIIGSISNAIASKQIQENNMSQKFAELQAQSASTAGSNDLNLLNFYNKNKLHEIKYELTDNMKQSIYDLFYYMGYATNIQKKPDLYSRSIFNFIMINPEFDNTLDATVNKEYIEDIKARLASGLTIWHDTTRHTYGYNNTERWILDQYVEE